MNFTDSSQTSAHQPAPHSQISAPMTTTEQRKMVRKRIKVMQEMLVQYRCKVISGGTVPDPRALGQHLQKMIYEIKDIFGVCWPGEFAVPTPDKPPSDEAWRKRRCEHCTKPVAGPCEQTCGSPECLKREYGA